MNQEFLISAQEAGQRLDVFVVSKLPTFSRAAIQKAIKGGQITIDNQATKPKVVIREGQTVAVNMEAAPVMPAPQTEMSIPIIFEDKDAVVINKPAGIAVHPGQGAPQYTIVDWALKKYPDIAKVGEDPTRPGIIHRLDKDTSGVMLIAKNQKAYEHFKTQFKRRHAKKEYLALTFGIPGEESGRIVRSLARSRKNPLRRTIDPTGKEAISEWRKEKTFRGRYALLRLFPLTGRTHQLRVHLHFLGFPIVGDNLYTFKRQRPPQGVKRQLLHAQKLTLVMPSGKPHQFVAPLTDDFAAVLESLT